MNSVRFHTGVARDSCTSGNWTYAGPINRSRRHPGRVTELPATDPGADRNRHSRHFSAEGSMTSYKAAVAVISLLVAGEARAQGGGAPAQQQPMGFFITSVGVGDGANLGGLEGADRHCQTLAAAA